MAAAMNPTVASQKHSPNRQLDPRAHAGLSAQFPVGGSLFDPVAPSRNLLKRIKSSFDRASVAGTGRGEIARCPADSDYQPARHERQASATLGEAARLWSRLLLHGVSVRRCGGKTEPASFAAMSAMARMLRS